MRALLPAASFLIGSGLSFLFLIEDKPVTTHYVGAILLGYGISFALVALIKGALDL